MDKDSTIQIIEQDGSIPAINAENQEEMPVINIVLNPGALQNGNNLLASPVPLFIKKLWKIVNDESNEKIISWNENGDGFVIHNQLKFISETLPRYFKHNQLSSFVRQLNLYDFHKVQPTERVAEKFHFTHPFFLKDIPQLLPLIKRKTQTGRQRANPTTNTSTDSPQQSPQVQEILTVIKEIKTKSDGISTEMTKLRQENGALWNEMNSLRVKCSKQTKIINKLIHFLIAYMQKHHNSRKPGRTVSTSNSNKYVKTGPKIMELDYKYKNNPHEFWSDYDNQHENVDQAYTVVEPAENYNECGDQPQDVAESQNLRLSSAIEEILPGSSASETNPQFDYANSRPSSSKSSNSALQRAGRSQEKMGYLIDNSQVKMNTIKELFKSLTPDDMTQFYKLVNENYKNQDDMLVDSEKDLNSLSQMSPLNAFQDYDIQLEDDDLVPLHSIIDNPETDSVSLLNDLIQTKTPDIPEFQPSNVNIDANAGLLGDNLLNTDELLNNVSVDQYFSIPSP